MKSNLASTKSQVAKLMATENITVEHRNVPTAMFDVKNRVLTLPNLKDGLSVNLYDLMTSHEVGHALFTPEQGWHDAVSDKGATFKGYLNIVEDARIEKKVKAKYPGLLKAYREGYKELLDRNFFGIAGKDITAMGFIDRINLHFKLGTLVNLKFEGEEAVWVDKIAAANTWEEVEAIATELYADEINKAEEELEEKLEEMLAQASDDSDENGGTETDGSDENEENESDDYQSSGSGSDSDDEDGDDYEDDDMGEFDETPMSAEESVESETDAAYRKNERSLSKNDNRQSKYYKFSDLKLMDNIVVPYSEVNKLYVEMFKYQPETLKEVQEKWKIWRSQNTKIVNYMVKEFEMRKKADEFKRTTVAKTGELDMKRIFQYKYNDDLFKKVGTVRGGKNHGFVMLLDWSGSMANNMSATIDQVLNMVMFCKKINMPFEVYAFTDHFGNRGTAVLDENIAVDTLIPGKDVKLMTLFNSKMKTIEFNNACLGMMAVRESLENGRFYRYSMPDKLQLGGTPFNSALLVMPEIIEKFRKNNRVQIANFVVMTDGESHECDVVEDYNGQKTATGMYNSYSVDAYVTDTVTKKTYSAIGRNITPALIEAIADRCDVQSIGFFIMDNRAREIKQQASRFGIYDSNVVNNIRTNKFLEITTAGYNSYFLIPGGKALETSPEGIMAPTGASKSKLKSAFMKASNAKTTNRVLLNRVMEMVS